MSSFKDERKYIIKSKDLGSFWYIRNYIDKEKGSLFFKYLKNQSASEFEEDESGNKIVIPKDNISNFWHVATVNVGRVSRMPRLIRQMSDSEESIHYGGKKHQTHKWDINIFNIRIDLMRRFGIFLDFCLCNYYRNGEDSINAHSDRESLGKRNVTLGFSLGQERDFIITKAKGGKAEHMEKCNKKDIRQTNKKDYDLLHCGNDRDFYRAIFHNKSRDLYCMIDAFHSNFVHEIQKEKKKSIGPRISLTFRQTKDDDYYRKKGIDTSDIEGQIKRLIKNKKDFCDPNSKDIGILSLFENEEIKDKKKERMKELKVGELEVGELEVGENSKDESELRKIRDFSKK